MAYKPTASFLATTCRIGMAHAFQTTACVPPFVGDTTLFYSNASLANHQKKEASTIDLNPHFDTQSQNSV
jgi:hypothetical protein